MATNLPALDSTMHTASVTYACTFSPTIAPLGSLGASIMFAVPKPAQYVFSFETGLSQPDPAQDLYVVNSDLSAFDQTTVEAAIAASLNVQCESIATLLGVTTAAVQATVTVQRAWRVNPNQVGSAARVQVPAAPIVYNEVMTYPVAAGKLTRLAASSKRS